jgi:hypothetical protein
MKVIKAQLLNYEKQQNKEGLNLIYKDESQLIGLWEKEYQAWRENKLENHEIYYIYIYLTKVYQKKICHKDIDGIELELPVKKEDLKLWLEDVTLNKFKLEKKENIKFFDIENVRECESSPSQMSVLLDIIKTTNSKEQKDMAIKVFFLSLPSNINLWEVSKLSEKINKNVNDFFKLCDMSNNPDGLKNWGSSLSVNNLPIFLKLFNQYDSNFNWSQTVKIGNQDLVLFDILFIKTLHKRNIHLYKEMKEKYNVIYNSEQQSLNIKTFLAITTKLNEMEMIDYFDKNKVELKKIDINEMFADRSIGERLRTNGAWKILGKLDNSKISLLDLIKSNASYSDSKYVSNGIKLFKKQTFNVTLKDYLEHLESTNKKYVKGLGPLLHVLLNFPLSLSQKEKLMDFVDSNDSKLNEKYKNSQNPINLILVRIFKNTTKDELLYVYSEKNITLLEKLANYITNSISIYQSSQRGYNIKKFIESVSLYEDAFPWIGFNKLDSQISNKVISSINSILKDNMLKSMEDYQQCMLLNNNDPSNKEIYTKFEIYSTKETLLTLKLLITLVNELNIDDEKELVTFMNNIEKIKDFYKATDKKTLHSTEEIKNDILQKVEVPYSFLKAKVLKNSIDALSIPIKKEKTLKF